MWAPAVRSISFLVPAVSKATSTRASLPMGRRDSTSPSPKVRWRMRSPFWSGSSGPPLAAAAEPVKPAAALSSCRGAAAPR